MAFGGGVDFSAFTCPFLFFSCGRIVGGVGSWRRALGWFRQDYLSKQGRPSRISHGQRPCPWARPNQTIWNITDWDASLSEVFSMKIGRRYGRRGDCKLRALHNARSAKTYTCLLITARGIFSYPPRYKIYPTLPLIQQFGTSTKYLNEQSRRR